MVTELTKETFQNALTDNDTIIVDFWAPWCGPCRSFAPIYEELSEQHPDVVFAKVNTEEERELAGAFGIRSIPTLMVFREKVMLYAQPGALPKHGLEDLVKRVKELDMEEVHRKIAEQEAQEKEGTTGQS
jgi:thioredoxin